MIPGNSVFPFVVSAVHVAIHQKVHVSAVLHGKDLYVMMVVVTAHIRAVIVPEGKDLHRTPCPGLIAPQIPVYTENADPASCAFY